MRRCGDEHGEVVGHQRTCGVVSRASLLVESPQIEPGRVGDDLQRQLARGPVALDAPPGVVHMAPWSLLTEAADGVQRSHGAAVLSPCLQANPA